MKYLLNVATLELYSDKCTGCQRCIEVCPHGVFVVENGKARVTDRDTCMECGACASNCEAGAIKVNTGVGCAAAIINSMIYGGAPSCDCEGTNQGTSSCC